MVCQAFLILNLIFSLQRDTKSSILNCIYLQFGVQVVSSATIYFFPLNTEQIA